MTRISTHVLDLAAGRPAVGMTVRLIRDGLELANAPTDSDGRCANLLPVNSEIEAGVYRLLFETELYLPDGFFPRIEIAFKATAETQHYHVPLLLSAFGYTTYRGS